MSPRARDTAEPAAQLRVFGFVPSPVDVEQAAAVVLAPTDRPRLAVTPNVDHVARLRRSPAFRRAYRRADLVLCDGFPVHAYVRLRHHAAMRVTGCALVAEIMRPGRVWADRDRLFFAVDTEATARGIEEWAALTGLGDRVAAAVPPHGFVSSEHERAALAGRIAAHGTTLLVMCVGAPQSEIFVERAHALLPPAWAICVGQAVKVELGLVRRAPVPAQALCLEWSWRLIQEPKRLGRRYALGLFDFLLAITEDLLDGGASLLADDP